MQFSRKQRTASLSPMRNKRTSVGFVNDYTASAQSNFAPAAAESPEILKQHHPPSGFLQSRRLGLAGGKEGDDWSAPLAKLSNRFLRRAREPSNSPPKSRQQQQQRRPKETAKPTTPPTTKSSKKSSEGKPVKEKRRVFQKLSDEKLPDYQKFRNRKTKADCMKHKLAAMDNFSQSGDTVATERSNPLLGESHNSEFPSPAEMMGKEDEDFVAGLIYFAPTSEGEIRNLVAKKPPAA